MNWQAQGINTLNPSTTDQANQTYGEGQQGLQNQNAFLQALNAQNGLANQSSVYNQYQGIANGSGPNPATAQLAQATGKNIAAQGALAAGQRGSSANVGLMARQAAQAGSAAQQQSAGQAATMQANQQLAALGQMGSIANNQVGNQANATNNYTQAAQNANSNVLNGIQGQNTANVGMQSNMNTANAGIQNTIANGQQAVFGGLMQDVSKGLGIASAATGGKIKRNQIGFNPVVRRFSDGDPEIAAPHGPDWSSKGEAQSDALNNMQFDDSKTMPASLSGANGYMGDMPSAQPTGDSTGSVIADHIKSNGGVKSDSSSSQQAPSGFTPGSGADALYKGVSSFGGPSAPSPSQVAQAAPLLAMAAAKGGKVPALVSPGEKYLTPRQADAVKAGHASPMIGKTLPGKAKVKGNSYANDTVPATLEEGGCVIPRSVMESKNPEKKAAEFVKQHMAKYALGGAVGMLPMLKESYKKSKKK